MNTIPVKQRKMVRSKSIKTRKSSVQSKSAQRRKNSKNWKVLNTSANMFHDVSLLSCNDTLKKEQKINQLFIFKKKVQTVEFELFKRIVVKDIPIFNKTCM